MASNRCFLVVESTMEVDVRTPLAEFSRPTITNPSRRTHSKTPARSPAPSSHQDTT